MPAVKAKIDFPHAAVVDKGCHGDHAVSSRGAAVGDEGEIFGALSVQSRDEVVRHAGAGKAAHHDAGAVRDAGDCLLEGCEAFGLQPLAFRGE